MFFPIFLRRKLRSLDVKSIVLVVLLFSTIIFILKCQLEHDCEKAKENVNYIKLNDNVEINSNPMALHSPLDREDYVYRYNRKLPITFIGGVPRSGTTLMRAILDAHPLIRCGEETRIIPRIISMRFQWVNNKKESERLRNAGITDDIVGSAISSFILEVITKHGKPAPFLCNKDPLVLRYSHYVSSLFPNGKFIFMIRDGRATVHSIISRKVTITGFNLESYRESLAKWSTVIEGMYAQCMLVGAERCLPVYYEKLILQPETEIRKIMQFLDIPWNDAVLHHEDHIGDEIKLSKIEKSTDQVVKPINLEALSSWVGKIPVDVLRDMDSVAPMLRKLGYDPYANPPNYGQADIKVKENTYQIRENREHWMKVAQQFSDHSDSDNNNNNNNNNGNF